MSTAPINDTIDLRAIFRKTRRQVVVVPAHRTIQLGTGVAYHQDHPKAIRGAGRHALSEEEAPGYGGDRMNSSRVSSYLEQQYGLEDRLAVLTSSTNMTRPCSVWISGSATSRRRTS